MMMFQERFTRVGPCWFERWKPPQFGGQDLLRQASAGEWEEIGGSRPSSSQREAGQPERGGGDKLGRTFGDNPLKSS